MSFSGFDHACMAEALRLAERGLVTTRPNPRVGCVIAAESRIVGRGWHERAGGPHAEVVALQDAGPDAKGATVYVTLEPCSHHGRTPPCADALVEAGVRRVVVASGDPHHAVDGAGMARLRAAGVTVEAGLMATAAESLNAGFLKRMRTGRPWVRIKTAVSLDGRTGLRNGESQWITGPSARRDVQAWRARSCAILTGIGTVLADDPALTARVSDPPVRPLRVIADSGWRTPPGARVIEPVDSVVIAGSRDRDVPDQLAATGVRCLPLPAPAGRLDLAALLDELGALEINEVQVEAGARLCGALLRTGLVDEIVCYQAMALLGEGGPGPFEIGELESMDHRINLECLETRRVGPDLRLRLRPGAGGGRAGKGD